MWEKISYDRDVGWSQRLWIPKGWIVRSYLDGHRGKAIHQIIVDDLEHTWELKRKAS